MRTKVFQSGNSQAVRIPFDFRFDVDTVEILQGQNGDVILRPVKLQADMEFLALFSDFDDDLFRHWKIEIHLHHKSEMIYMLDTNILIFI